MSLGFMEIDSPANSEVHDVGSSMLLRPSGWRVLADFMLEVCLGV